MSLVLSVVVNLITRAQALSFKGKTAYGQSSDWWRSARSLEKHERQEVLDKLITYRDRLEKLMDLIGGKTTLTDQEKASAQSQLKSLKETIEADYDYCHAVSNEDKLTQAEGAFFRPAVRDMRAAIRMRSNTHPIRSNWQSGLYEARSDLDHWFGQLERLSREEH